MLSILLSAGERLSWARVAVGPVGRFGQQRRQCIIISRYYVRLGSGACPRIENVQKSSK